MLFLSYPLLLHNKLYWSFCLILRKISTHLCFILWQKLRLQLILSLFSLLLLIQCAKHAKFLGFPKIILFQYSMCVTTKIFPKIHYFKHYSNICMYCLAVILLFSKGTKDLLSEVKLIYTCNARFFKFTVKQWAILVTFWIKICFKYFYVLFTYSQMYQFIGILIQFIFYNPITNS